MPDLIWDHCSPWNTPHANDLYTQGTTLFDSDNKYHQTKLSFFVSSLRLIAKETTDYGSKDTETTTYFNLGEFVDTIDKGEVIESIKQYADYVLHGYIKSRNFLHCPSFEPVYDVDNDFNPI